MEDSSLRQASNELHIQLAGDDARTIIILHISHLKQKETSDDLKIKSLTDLFLSIIANESIQHWIIVESGLLLVLSELMSGTVNPQIRSLCGSLILVVQQLGAKSGEAVDWRTLLSPLFSLLFNIDENISQSGKQSLLKAIDHNPDAIKGLVELNIYDRSSQMMDFAYPQSSTSQSPYLESVLVNVLEVVAFALREGSEIGKKTAMLLATLMRIKQLQPSKQIKSVIGSILSILEDEHDDSNDNKIIQNQLLEAQQQVILAQNKAKLAEEQIIAAEQKAQQSEQRMLEVNEQIRIKDQQINRLQAQIAKNHPDSILIQQIVLPPRSGEEDYTSELENPDPIGSGVRLERVGRLFRKAINMRDQVCASIILDKEIADGIHSITIRFDKNNVDGYVNGRLGIMKANYRIQYPCEPWLIPHRNNMLGYGGYSGFVKYKTIQAEGNIKYSDFQLITMELNANIGTLHYFVEGSQQPIFVQGINEPVKFWFLLYQKDASFTILSLNRLDNPTTKILANSKAIDW
ncbi:MAG: hypothetical protein EZS28_001682 [Streblomastix strix]|uniref:Uncharacterized protein n=1 Tax=Streblomastix strix TaxID=222440 RepID=A0A5J4X7G2_9EUKA|nr:MAG: hypothetical protein EZS28_001682 [Streblomastix strix]